jgi:hypothetical protein
LFEKIAVRQLLRAPEVFDVGALSELLIFYQNVHLVLSKGALGSLIKTIGVDDLLYLLDSGLVKISFTIDDPATHTKNQGGLEVHDFGAIKIVGHVETGKINKEENVRQIILRHSQSVPKIEKKIRRILDVMPITHLAKGLPPGVSIEAETRREVLGAQFSSLIVAIIYLTQEDGSPILSSGT